MQDDCIAVALGLPQLKILWQRESEGHIEVTVIYRRDKVTCPRCGKVTTREHDRRSQCKQDRRLRDKVVFLQGYLHSSWTEVNSSFVIVFRTDRDLSLILGIDIVLGESLH